jgi:methyltransferase (TIGR00027 family)
MSLPNLSNSMYVAHLRHIQSVHEPADRRNPDTMVRYFLPVLKRLRSAWIRPADLDKLRADPFYYYLLARTKYYDDVLAAAVAQGIKHLVMIGSGSDTRAYRFQELLNIHGVTVLECDQPQAIRAKQFLTKRRDWPDNVEYLPIDLNDGVWPELEGRLAYLVGSKALMLMEGVSPYVNEGAFGQFLRLLATRLTPGSLLAYDFKIAGARDDFGRSEKTVAPFRLPADRDRVRAYHQDFGLDLEYMELSSDLYTRVVPGLAASGAPVFLEDGLVRLRVSPS